MNTVWRAVSTLILLAPIPLHPAGVQEIARIYPVYEGWAANEDGTATLVFGYFSESPDAVRIAPGSANGFTSGALDRGQPTLFRPGRQRSVCAIVVGPGFEGNLQWSIEWNGTSTSTSEHGGTDPLYLLEEIGSSARVARGIDTASASKGVCVNRAPTVRAGTDQKIDSRSVLLRGFVTDEGLPRDGTLEISWRLVSGPGTVTFEDASDPRTRVDFSEPGSYELELTANDSEKTASGRVTVKVEVS